MAREIIILLWQKCIFLCLNFNLFWFCIFKMLHWWAAVIAIYGMALVKNIKEIFRRFFKNFFAALTLVIFSCWAVFTIAWRIFTCRTLIFYWLTAVVTLFSESHQRYSKLRTDRKIESCFFPVTPISFACYRSLMEDGWEKSLRIAYRVLLYFT